MSIIILWPTCVTSPQGKKSEHRDIVSLEGVLHGFIRLHSSETRYLIYHSLMPTHPRLSNHYLLSQENIVEAHLCILILYSLAGSKSLGLLLGGRVLLLQVLDGVEHGERHVGELTARPVMNIVT